VEVGKKTTDAYLEEYHKLGRKGKSWLLVPWQAIRIWRVMVDHILVGLTVVIGRSQAAPKRCLIIIAVRIFALCSVDVDG